eukprot:1039769-Alexandrium_andersonii.AAC.1
MRGTSWHLISASCRVQHFRGDTGGPAGMAGWRVWARVKSVLLGDCLAWGSAWQCASGVAATSSAAFSWVGA